MKYTTLAYLINLLDTQYAHIKSCAATSKSAGEQQRIYYTGLHDMFNAMISDAFENDLMLSVDEYGKHSIQSVQV